MNVEDVKNKIAYRISQIRGGDPAGNYIKACEILESFMERRVGDPVWEEEHRDYQSLFGDIIYG